MTSTTSVIAATQAVVAVTPDDVRALLGSYEVVSEEVEELVNLATHYVEAPREVGAYTVALGRRGGGACPGVPETRMNWRNSYTDLAYSRPELPGSARKAVLRYCRELGLVYGAFDFVVRPDRTWVFLECNAGGQYGWIEDAIGAPITAAIADLLTAGPVC